MGKHRTQEVDLERYQKWCREYVDGSLQVGLPPDMLAYLRTHRLMDKDGGGLKGCTLQIDAFTFGVTVFIKIEMGGALRVIVKDGDGMELLGTWERES